MRLSFRKKAIISILLSSIFFLSYINLQNSTKADDIIYINFTHDLPENSIYGKTAYLFKKQVEEESLGKVKVNISYSSKYEKPSDLLENIQSGKEQVTIIPTARLSSIIPELQLLDLPYLFPNRNIALRVLDGSVGDTLLKILENHSIKGIAFCDEGFKKITSNKKITKLDDFNDLKFRAMESPIIMSQFKSLGVTPSVLDFSLTYNYLKSGMLDGQENPLCTIDIMRFYEVQKYIIDSNHGYLANVFMFSKTWYDDLPKDIQSIIYKAGIDACTWQREEVSKQEVKLLEKFKNYGCEIIKFSPEEEKKIEEITSIVHSDYVKMYGHDLLNKTYQDIQKLKDMEGID